MIPLRPRVLSWLGLLLLAALTTLLAWRIPEPLAPAKKRNEGVDHALLQTEIKLFDDTGRLGYTLSAARVEHRAESGDYVLTDLRLEALPTQPHADGWIMQADRGRLTADRRYALLEQNVRARRTHVEEEQVLTLHSERLRLDLPQRQAHSDGIVTITSAYGTSQSAGIDADILHRTLIQRDRVHDQYLPPRRP